MKPLSIVVVALLSTAAVPALACDKDEQASFPMKADAFQQKVDQKIGRIRARTAQKVQERGLNAEQAKQERARVETVLAAIKTAANKAAADGTVTAEEAQTVRAAGRELFKHKRDKANTPKS